MGVYHAFASTQADPPNTPANQAILWGSDWDRVHDSPDWLLAQVCCHGAAMTPYVVPASITEFLGLTIHRTRFDLTYVDQIRLTAYVSQPASSNATLRAQWSNDGGATWNSFTLIAAGSNPYVPLNVAGCITSGWQSLSATAKAAGDVLVRLAMAGGDGATAVKLGSVHLHVF